MCSLLLLTACASEVIKPQPVPVPVPGPVQWREVPPKLLLMRQKTTIPETATYGEALQLWVEDRSTIDKLLGQLQGIASLSDSNGD